MTNINLVLSSLDPKDAAHDFIIKAGDLFVHEIKQGQYVDAAGATSGNVSLRLSR